jgi:hypothetical protein
MVVDALISARVYRVRASLMPRMSHQPASRRAKLASHWIPCEDAQAARNALKAASSCLVS